MKMIRPISAVLLYHTMPGSTICGIEGFLEICSYILEFMVATKKKLWHRHRLRLFDTVLVHRNVGGEDCRILHFLRYLYSVQAHLNFIFAQRG